MTARSCSWSARRSGRGSRIGYGIRIIGIGGIIGIDRRADTDALRERLTSGAVGNILFAEDPVRNAPILLGDLAALFPVKRRLPRPRADGAARVARPEGRVPGAARDRRDRRARLVRTARPRRSCSARCNISVPEHESFLDVKVDAIGVLDFHAADARDRRDDPARRRDGPLQDQRRRRRPLELGRHAVPDGDARRVPPEVPSRAGGLPEAQPDPHHRRQVAPAGRASSSARPATWP